jgi:hypothetical protein
MRATGKRLSRLRAAGTSSFAWDPAGQHIAYIGALQPDEKSSAGRYAGIRISDLAGHTRLLSAMDSGTVSWSGSNKLAWDSNLNHGEPSDVWVGDARGERAMRLLTYAKQPRWSLSGHRLAFQCRSALCVSRSDGSRRHVLTRKCQLDVVDETAPPGFAWSPDGREIACADRRGNLIVVLLRSKHTRLVRRAFDFPLAAELGEIDWQRRPRPH